MKWSWRLGRLFGIDVFVHATFVLFLGWVALSAYVRERSGGAVLGGVLFMLAVFGSVLLHELGHALTARSFGVRTRDITLLPIGGLARLERMPDEPRQELLVALAGPAVNVCIAAALYFVLYVTGQGVVAEPNLIGPGPFFTRLLWVNVSLAVFNLLPAFPMDGGRALRAVLALGGDYVRATRLAAKLGQAIAIMLGLLGIVVNPMLAFIALFVWIGAAAEAAGVERKALLHGLPTSCGMETRFEVLSVDDRLGAAAQRLLAGSQVDFPVLAPNGALAGMLTRGALIDGLRERSADAPVGLVIDQTFAVARPTELLEVSLARLEASPCQAMPVMENGTIVGIVTTANVGELLMVLEALRIPGWRVPRPMMARR